MNSNSAPPHAGLSGRPLPPNLVRACRIINRLHLVLTVLPALWTILVLCATFVFFEPILTSHSGHRRDQIIQFAGTHARPDALMIVDFLGWAQFVAIPVWIALTATIKQPMVGLRERWRTTAFVAGLVGIACVLTAAQMHLAVW